MLYLQVTLQVLNIKDTSIKRPSLGEFSPMVKRCIDIMFHMVHTAL